MGSLDEFVREEVIGQAMQSPIHALGASLVSGAVGLAFGMGSAATIPMFLAYAGLNVAREYKHQPLVKRNARKNVAEKLTEFFVENPTVSGLCSGVYIGIADLVAKCMQNGTSAVDLPADVWKQVGFAGAVAGFLGDIGVRAVRSMRKMKVKKEEKKTVAAVVDLITEHPIEIGALIALGHLPHIVEGVPGSVYPQGREVYVWDYVRDVPLVAAVTFGFAAIGIAALGTVAHSTSRKFIAQEYGEKLYYRVREYFAKKNTKAHWREKRCTLQHIMIKDAPDLETRIRQEINLGDVGMADGREEEAFYQYRTAARLLTHKARMHIAPHTFFREWLNIGGLQGNLVPKTNREVILKGFHGLLHGKKSALQYWKEVYDKNKDGSNGEEYSLLYAQGLDFVGRKRESRALKMQLAEKVYREKGMQAFSRVSKNKVGKLKSEVLKTELIVKEGDVAMLERESALTESAAQIFAERADWYVPKIIGLIEVNGGGVLVEEIVGGQDLYDTLLSGKITSKELYPVGDALAFFQANTDVRNLGKERDDFQVTVDRYQMLGLSKDNIGLLRSGLQPVLQSMDGTERVAMKDAQPENVRIGDEGVCLLDWEGVRPSSIVIDLANLLEYVSPVEKKDRLGVDEKLDVVHYFLEKFSTYRGEKLLRGQEAYDLAYLNAGILRTLQWRPTLYPRQRPDPLRATFEHTLEAFDAIKQRFPKYFQNFKGEYCALERFLNNLHMEESAF